MNIKIHTGDSIGVTIGIYSSTWQYLYVYILNVEMLDYKDFCWIISITFPEAPVGRKSL